MREALDSVLGQSFRQWQLCLVDDGSSDAGVGRTLSEYRQRDRRIDVFVLDHNQGIAAATNAGIARCRGRYLVLMDHDDVLAEGALDSVAEAIAARPDGRLFYSDADRIDMAGNPVEPYCKPAFDYDLLLGQNYLNHLTVLDAALMQSLHGLRGGYEGSQDYDLYLRAVETIEPAQIVHIPRILYHWRKVASSVSASSLAAAAAAGRRAVQDHLERRGLPARVRANPDALIYNRVQWLCPQPCLTVLVYSQQGQCSQATLLAIAGQSFAAGVSIQVQVMHTTSAADIEQWLPQQSCEIVCLVADGIMPDNDSVLATLLGYFGRPEVTAVAAAERDMDGAFRYPQALNDTSEPQPKLLDRQLDHLAPAGCVMLRRAALVVQGGDRPLRCQAQHGVLVWSPQAVVKRTNADMNEGLVVSQLR